MSSISNNRPPSSYTVVQGDTLYNISQKEHVDLAQLEALNATTINNPNLIYPDQQILLPLDAEEQTAPTGPRNNVATTSGGPGGGPEMTYSGPATNFPDASQWQSFDAMWAQASHAMASVDSPQEIDWIKEGIMTEAARTGIDPRIILGVIMQESSGNVRVPTTNNGITNPGLMQSHNGVSFDPSDPHGSILQMIKDGVEGTASGDGLQQLIARSGNVYVALRLYNSGNAYVIDLSNPMGAQGSYVSDIANKLMGATI